MSHFGRKGPPDISDTYSLLVQDISFRTTADDLYTLFAKYGKVMDVFIPRDRRTGDSRGYAFVRFKYQDEANKAVDRLDGRVVDGRDITVQFAKYGRNAERISKGRVVEPAPKSRYRSRSRSPRRSRSPSRRRSSRRSRSPRRRSRDDSRERDYRRRSRSRSRSYDRHDRDRHPSKNKDYYRRSRSRSASPDDKRRERVPLLFATSRALGVSPSLRPLLLGTYQLILEATSPHCPSPWDRAPASRSQSPNAIVLKQQKKKKKKKSSSV